MRRIVAVALVALAAAACGSTAGGSSMLAFAGYKWSVVAIGHDSKETPVPARYNVYLQFAPNGQYGANDPVNYHFGTYRARWRSARSGTRATTRSSRWR